MSASLTFVWLRLRQCKEHAVVEWHLVYGHAEWWPVLSFARGSKGVFIAWLWKFWMRRNSTDRLRACTFF